MSFTLKDVVTFTEPFVSNLPLFYSDTIEPAASIAQTLLCTILSPPFVWEWNRKDTGYTVTQALSPPLSPPEGFSTDATVEISDFGFLECATLTVPDTAENEPGKIYQLNIERDLEQSSDLSRPTQISVHEDDLAGNITFRLHMCPDMEYPIGLTYQKAAVKFTSATQVWPMPDKLRHLVNFGFLGLAFLYNNDSRFQEMSQRFVAHLLGTQTGLDEAAKNLFAAAYLGQMQGQVAATGRAQQGVQARAV
jgi:hypothetical protein